MLCGAYNVQYDLPPDLQIKFYSWWDHPEIWDLLTQDVPEGKKYIHANWAETAGVLATRPDLVKMDRAVNENDIFTQFDYTLEQVTHSGVCGRNATGATPEDGEMILSRAADVVTQMVEQMLVETIPIRVPRDGTVKQGFPGPS
jgi:creatinine amidohydrolase/Fe(II)-dependent formamide hydrolase-like protein